MHAKSPAVKAFPMLNKDIFLKWRDGRNKYYQGFVKEKPTLALKTIALLLWMPAVHHTHLKHYFNRILSARASKRTKRKNEDVRGELSKLS